ncbi:hypothetical protein H6B11_15190 [Mediterraneibacter glycyrrhizinilyticus]|nr:hypothetical protein [Mediterraneibacter glycyrrhizinilyticus]MBM6855476.1 hypothetical protein [Mediterraneibacter glycyrrhizinilyticus]
MTLSQEDGQLYYKLWLTLLDFVNKTYGINKKLKNMAEAKNLDPAEVKEVANKLWSEVEIIDRYIKENPELQEEHKEIIQGWKRRIQGKFIMERHLKKGTIFISMEDEQVYQVSGIISSWEEMFYGAPMPLIVEATFIPFRDVIISDGLVMPYNIMIGGEMKRMFKDVYMAAKKSGQIQRSL